MALSDNAGRIVAAGLHGLFVVLASILFTLGLLRARRHSDPARAGLAWLRAVFIFAITGATLTLLTYALTLHISHNALGLAPSPAAAMRTLRIAEASMYISTVGVFLSLVSDILLLATLVELARGFVLTRRARAARIAKPAYLAAAGVLGVLALVVFGMAVRYNWGVMAQVKGRTGYSGAQMVRDTLVVARLSGALEVLLFVGSLGVVGWVVGGVVRGAVGGVKKTVTLLLTASVVTALRALGLMVITCLYGFAITVVEPEVLFIVRPVIDLVPLLVVLALLFVVTVRKEGGLWSAAPVGGPAMGQMGWYGQAQEGEYAPQGAPLGGYYKP
ncbi:hypothetical protein QBC39DRAFT_371390 [Podospora conica]|nr:hypothetical protein QBC39DRAFT_371390 [Schizothecium conicum]